MATCVLWPLDCSELQLLFSPGCELEEHHLCFALWGGPESFVELQLHSAPAGGGELCLNNSVNSVKQQHELRAVFPKHE